jgi:hypothetical protein
MGIGAKNASDSKSGPQFERVLHFGPWSRISSIKSLIGHQTSIFIQLSPWSDQINSQKLYFDPRT